MGDCEIRTSVFMFGKVGSCLAGNYGAKTVFIGGGADSVSLGNRVCFRPALATLSFRA